MIRAGRVLGRAGILLSWLLWVAPARAAGLEAGPAVPPPSHRPVLVRVMTYNIHHGAGLHGRENLREMALLIRDSEADLIGLQEVDRGFGKRSAFRDQLAELAALTGFEAAFLPAVTREAGAYGPAVLSRYPMLRKVGGLYSAGREPRGYLAVEVGMEEALRVGFAVTHLSPDPAERAAQIEELLVLLRQFPGPLVLAGDFNLRPEDGDFRSLTAVLRDALAAFDAGGRATFFPAPDAEGARIDFIFVSAEFRPEGGRVVEMDYSDHRPVLAHLSLAREDSAAMAQDNDKSWEPLEWKAMSSSRSGS